MNLDVLQCQVQILEQSLNAACYGVMDVLCGPRGEMFARSSYKLCLMVYKALSRFAPTYTYVTEVCISVVSIRPHSALRSAALCTWHPVHPTDPSGVWQACFAPWQAQWLGTTCLTMFGARQHVTSLNSV